MIAHKKAGKCFTIETQASIYKRENRSRKDPPWMEDVFSRIEVNIPLML
jgi:hypothetical protein